MSTPYYQDDRVTLYHGKSEVVLRDLPDASVDSVVCDPPYELGFMGKGWDGTGIAYSVDLWREVHRVLKPGGHLLAFGGTRTWHRLACAVEDAGFEMRDSIAWLYGSGFPKSLDVSKAIDKANGRQFEDRFALGRHIRERREALGYTRAEVNGWLNAATKAEHYESDSPGFARVPTLADWRILRDRLNLSDEHRALVERVEAEREVLGAHPAPKGKPSEGWGHRSEAFITAPATDAAREWAGFGTALKPAHEPVVWARKPLNAVPLWSEATALHHMIGGLLWLSLSPAKRAELTSPSSPAVQPAGTCVSALVTAATATSPGGFAETGTCSSPATASTSSSIASSWSSILGALSDPTSTSTTSMKSSTTTALTTLSSLLAPLTSPSTMPQCGCLTSGSSSSAPSAAETSTDEWANWLHTLSASVPASAIEGTALVAASALAQAAAALSTDRPESSAAPTATTGAGASPSPAFEPVVVARKPLAGTVAANVLQHGTGALNIDGCRIGDGDDRTSGGAQGSAPQPMSWGEQTGRERPSGGRWPANVVLDESQAAALDEQSGEVGGSGGTFRDTDRKTYNAALTGTMNRPQTPSDYGKAVGASRFFYVAKADTTERPRVNGTAHPTVKPLSLMRWLVRLVTPPGGTVLEPFAGSGTTVEACIVEGFDCIAIEKGEEYLPLITQRIHRQRNPVEAIRQTGADLGLFELDGEGA